MEDWESSQKNPSESKTDYILITEEEEKNKWFSSSLHVHLYATKSKLKS